MFDAREGILNLRMGRLVALAVSYMSHSITCSRRLRASRMRPLVGFLRIKEPKEEFPTLLVGLVQLKLDLWGAVPFCLAHQVSNATEDLRLCCF